MNKKIISLLLSFVLLLSVACPVAFADSDTATHTHTWVDTAVSFDMEVCGLSVKINVKKCDGCGWYLHTANVVGFQFNYPSVHSLRALDGELIDALTSFVVRVLGQNATASKYETGGGSAGAGGVGRNPSGYSGTGVPTYNADGEYQITVYPSLSPYGSSYLEDYPADITYNTSYSSWNISGLTVSGRAVGTSSDRVTMYFAYKIVNPSVSGLYYIKTDQDYATHVLRSDKQTFYRYAVSANSYSSKISSGITAVTTIKSGDFPLYVAKPGDVNSSVVSYFHPIVVTVIPDKSSVKQQTNITINSNTWNGNVYQDNSTNLTYIYPQYTTINENNETVTNISNNPIIYNNETKQYYTYDTVTNNYYYITYETPTPSPSPSPDPTPTPDPGTNPTPTPEPGGDTGDTNSLLDVLVQIRDNMIQGFADIKATLVQGWADLSANVTLAIENLNLNITNIFNKKFPDQSTPETAKPSPSPSPSPSPTPDPDSPDVTPTPTPPTTKPSGGSTNNFWNFVFPGGNDDGTENGHKGILWALISLLIAVVTFVLGLGSAYSYVFPFLPAGLVTTIHICVLVLLLFAIIKFVRSFL